MISVLLAVGILFSLFVGFNIGGSSTGIAWGPPVGAGIVKKTTAALLMSIFVFIGGITVGQNVIDTLSQDVLSSSIPLYAGVAILFFIGSGILIANVFGVPVPTSMTTVASIVGYGAVQGTVSYAVIGRIASWWIVTPIIGFWIGGFIGRYIYPSLNEKLDIKSVEGSLIEIEADGYIPSISTNEDASRADFLSAMFVILIGCYMSFSAGASNIPNAVAPLVSSGVLEPTLATIIATIAIFFGGITIARRTMESVGTQLTDIPLLVALIVMIVTSTITTLLSYIGIPISLVMATVMTIVGIGWGRATRPVTLRESISSDAQRNEINFAAMKGDEATKEITPIGEQEPSNIQQVSNLFNPRAVIKYISMWIIGPSVSAFLSYAFFSIVLTI